MGETREGSNRTGLEIAVIGMAGRFPGAGNIDEFWDSLKKGVESISFFSDDELRKSGIDEESIKATGYVRAKGVLEGIEYFDASFFGYLPEETEMMDPQMRIFHECAWEALEHAGYDPQSYDGLIGLFAGLTPNFIWAAASFIRSHSGSNQLEADYLNGNFFSTLISYKLNLKGPSVTVQTACSTSLVAIHQACRALITGECHMALAGGVTITLPQKYGYLYEEGMIHSPDGHCRAFDARAGGIIGGNGVGIVVLKNLDEASADGDVVWAVVKGTAVNNDGNRKVGYTAPSVEGQVAVIKAAHQVAEVEPESIRYIEAHGTGTTFGDPIEVEALKRSFASDRTGFCAIGAVKTNVGHLDSAAGAAGFIKTVLALKYRLLPPTLNFETPNPKIDFDNSPFYVNTGLSQWKSNGGPLRAGVSSFGIGGTNAHVVLEEGQPVLAVQAGGAKLKERPYRLILLSAASSAPLEQATRNLANHFEKNPAINLGDAAYTLQVGRQAFPHRRMLISTDVTEAAAALRSPESAKVHTFWLRDENRPLVFMFPGQGAQYADMGSGLYRWEPVFRLEMDRGFGLLESMMGFDLKKILYPCTTGAERINQTEIAQPLLFIFEYALAKLLEKWGINPQAMIGHSVGEYVAACLSGVFTLEDGLRLVVSRGKLMQQVPLGAMLSVPLAEEALKPLLDNELALAAVNGPSHCVVSGPSETVAAFEKRLRAMGCEPRPLHTSHAFHSAMMEPILEEFEAQVKSIKLNEPVKPYISNLSGTWITVEDAVDPGYWARHLRHTVRFADGLAELLKEKNFIFLEIGPGQTLAAFVRQYGKKKSRSLVLNLVRHPREDVDDYYHLLSKIGQLWLHGKKIDWRGFYFEEKRSRVPLPTYPFERRRYWKNAEVFKNGLEIPPAMSLASKTKDIARWFYVPSWKRSVLSDHRALSTSAELDWLVFIGQDDFGHRLVDQLRQDGHRLITVRIGSSFCKINEQEYAINPREAEDFDALFKELWTSARIPKRLVHLWCINENLHRELDMECLDKALELGFYGLLHIARGMGKQDMEDGIQIMVVTNNMHEVSGAEILRPESAALLGAVRVIPKEYPGFTCQNIDFVMPVSDDRQKAKVIGQLLEEFKLESSDMVVAYRDHHRWVQTFEPLRLDDPAASLPRLRERGVYLISGGLGGMGLVLAEHLARSVKARLILTGRSAFPPRQKWEEWIKNHGYRDRVSAKVTKLRELEALGAEVMVCSADVADFGQMRQVMTLAEQKFGPLHGVIHAAGQPGGGLIQGATEEILKGTLAPKLRGTLVLDKLLQAAELDFFILCSSLNSILPTIGQAGYCAANAFLDMFALYRTLIKGKFTVSINWDAWQEVGMAVRALEGLAREMKISGAAQKSVSHPLFDYCMAGGAGEVIYVAHLDAKQWVLNEHRVMGKATLPGTALLEMARGAFEDHRGQKTMALRDVYFFYPMMVEDDENREVHTILKKQGGESDFFIRSRLALAEDGWIDHARGKITALEPQPPRQHDIVQIQGRCRDQEIIVTGEFMARQDERDGHELQFGPRWHNIKKLEFGADQVLVHLELSKIFEKDTLSYKLHPALLDAAVGSFREEDTDMGLALPFSYKKIGIKAPLPRKVYSHIRYLETNRQGKNFLNYNVTIMDEEGRELVDIEEYSRLTISGDARSLMPQPSSYPGNRVESSPGKESALLKNGILPTEGIEVFNRLLSSWQPQVLVSSRDLMTRLKQYNASKVTDLPEELEEMNQPIAPRTRPELSTPFVGPRNEVEQKLARIWQDFLGIKKLGIHDDFFELGGDSLKVINIIPKIHKALDVEIPLAEFFNHPNISGIGAYINRAGKSKHFRVERAEKKEYYKLSSAQKRLYVLQQMDVDSTAYNLAEMAVVSEVDYGAVKVEELCGRLIGRHDSLRTRFLKVDNEPVQRIEEQVEFGIDYFEPGAAGGEAVAREEEIIKNFIKPFALDKAPLLRVCLIKVEAAKYVLMIDLHHIIADGLSLAIILRELQALYRGQELPELNIRYIDYSEWHGSERQRRLVKDQEKYWLNEFQGDIPVLSLARDYIRPPIMSFEGDKVSFGFDESETLSLKNLALAEEVTLFMLLLAIYTILLAKLSDQEDIIVGSPVAGRRHTDLEGIVGMFVNTLALRNFPKQGLTFKAFLNEVRERALRALQNQDYQFEDLVDAVVVNRDMSRNPLFDAMLIFQNLEYPMADMDNTREEASDSNIKTYEYERRTTRFDLNLQGFESMGKLVFGLEYSTKLFKRERIEWFSRYFKDIALAVLDNPEIKLADIHFIYKEEKGELLSQFNDEL